jgi:hypothetical protein
MMADQDRDWNSWNSRGRLFSVIGRLKASALTSEPAGILRSHSAEEPAQFVTMRKDLEVRVTPLRDWLTGGVRRPVLVLQVSVAMLLFVACIAALEVVRGTSRERGIMVRPAVGAAPRRLVRQLLTESSLLSAAGGFLGAALGCGNVGLLRNSFPQIHNWPIPCARTLL